MGYYSDLSLERLEADYDRSYPTPEKRLLWRLDDLYDRLDVLVKTGASYSGRTRLNDNDIRYAIPSYFENLSDVERAIELAMTELNFQKIIFYRSSNTKDAITFTKRELANCRAYHIGYEYKGDRNDYCSRF